MSRSFSARPTTPGNKFSKKKTNKRFRFAEKTWEEPPKKRQEVVSINVLRFKKAEYLEPSFIRWLVDWRGEQEARRLIRKWCNK